MESSPTRIVWWIGWQARSVMVPVSSQGQIGQYDCVGADIRLAVEDLDEPIAGNMIECDVAAIECGDEVARMEPLPRLRDLSGIPVKDLALVALFDQPYAAPDAEHAQRLAEFKEVNPFPDT